MIIAVDTLFMAERLRYTGTGKYLRLLLAALLKIVARDTPEIVFHGFADPRQSWAHNDFVSPLLKVHRARTVARRRAWILGGMAINVARVRPDLVFSPSAHSSLPHPFLPFVTTIHDAIPARLPANLVDVGKAINAMTWANAKAAKSIITVSYWSKHDLVEAYGVDPDKIAVIYEAVDERLYNATPADPQRSAALLSRFGIRQPFMLHHGMVQLRKNLDRLIRAYDRLRDSDGGCDAQLVLAGPMGPNYEEVLRVREASPYRDHIVVTGVLDDAELSLLVKSADACVIPSLYEGFCFPLLEAMACGVPTVASKSSCIPEISGGVLEYFDPYSIEEMAKVLRCVLENTGLRARLRRGGLERVAQFSWENCAQQTLHVFKCASLKTVPQPVEARKA